MLAVTSDIYCCGCFPSVHAFSTQGKVPVHSACQVHVCSGCVLCDYVCKAITDINSYSRST